MHNVHIRNKLNFKYFLFFLTNTFKESTIKSKNIFRKLRKVTLLPYYGGAKGQSLQITESDDGRITTAIIKTPPKVDNTAEEEAINASELENPPLPSKLDEFGNNIKNIHSTALKIIALQEKVKKNGRLSESEEAIYKKNMDSLSMSAQNLAMIQEQAAAPFEFENREGLSAWLDRKKITSSGSKKKEEEDKNKEDQKRKEEEDKKKQEQEGGGEEAVNEPDDSVSINLPPEDASVAEAKPVGLAIAGEFPNFYNTFCYFSSFLKEMAASLPVNRSPLLWWDLEDSPLRDQWALP